MKRLFAAVVATTVFVGALMVLQVLPVRAYVDQKREYEQTAARLTLLKKENADLGARARRLKTSAEIEKLARKQFGMVKPGEVVYAIPGLVRDGEWSSEDPAPSTTVAPPPRSLWRRALDAVTFWN